MRSLLLCLGPADYFSLCLSVYVDSLAIWLVIVHGRGMNHEHCYLLGDPVLLCGH